MPLGEIVTDSGLNKPTTRRLLLALMRAGLVEQEPQTRRYCLGEEAFVLGVLAARRHGLLELAMDEPAPALRRSRMDTSFLTVRRENYAVCLHREEGTYPVRTHALQAGDQHPLGVGAGSLAMLAALPDDDVDRVIAANEAVLLARYPGFAPDAIRADIALDARARLLAQSRPARRQFMGHRRGLPLSGRARRRRFDPSPRSTAACSRRGRRELAGIWQREVARMEALLARDVRFQTGRQAHGGAPRRDRSRQGEPAR